MSANVVQLLLMQLEDTLSAADNLNEDSRADELRRKIQTHRDRLSRIKSALAKHRDAEKRRRELRGDNDRRNPKRDDGKVGG